MSCQTSKKTARRLERTEVMSSLSPPLFLCLSHLLPITKPNTTMRITWPTCACQARLRLGYRCPDEAEEKCEARGEDWGEGSVDWLQIKWLRCWLWLRTVWCVYLYGKHNSQSTHATCRTLPPRRPYICMCMCHIRIRIRVRFTVCLCNPPRLPCPAASARSCVTF